MSNLFSIFYPLTPPISLNVNIEADLVIEALWCAFSEWNKEEMLDFLAPVLFCYNVHFAFVVRLHVADTKHRKKKEIIFGHKNLFKFDD